MELKTLIGSIIFVWICFFLGIEYEKITSGEKETPFSTFNFMILHFLLWPLMFFGAWAPFWTIGLIAFYIFDLIKGNT